MHLICCCDPYGVISDVDLHLVLLTGVNQDNMAGKVTGPQAE